MVCLPPSSGMFRVADPQTFPVFKAGDALGSSAFSCLNDAMINVRHPNVMKTALAPTRRLLYRSPDSPRLESFRILLWLGIPNIWLSRSMIALAIDDLYSSVKLVPLEKRRASGNRVTVRLDWNSKRTNRSIDAPPQRTLKREVMFDLVC